MCKMLFCCTRELKAEFSLHIEQVINSMISLLWQYLHSGIRTIVIEALPYIVAQILF